MSITPRGDIAFTIDGTAYTLRPTFQCLCDIEAQTGQPILTLAEKLAEGQLRLDEMAIITAAAVHPQVEVARMGEEILRRGVAEFLAVMSAFFHVALTGDTSYNVKKKARIIIGDWQALMQLGLGVLKLPPAVFWAMSIPEFKAAMEGHLRGIGVEEGEGVSREEFIALQQKFPD